MINLIGLSCLCLAYQSVRAEGTVDCNIRDDNLQLCLFEIRKSANWTKLVETKTHMAENCINKQQDLTKRDKMSKCHQSHSQTERCASEMRNDQTVKNMRNLFRSKYAESVAQHPACPFHVLKDNPSEGIHKGECVIHRDNNSAQESHALDGIDEGCQLLEECVENDVATDKGSMRILIQYADGVLTARRLCLLLHGPLLECMAAMKSDSHSQQERSSVMMAEKHFMETCSSGGAIPHPVANNNNINNADNHSSNSTNSHPTTSEIHQATQHPEEMTHNHTLLNATMHGGEQRVNETHIDYHELNNTTNTHREDHQQPTTTTHQNH